MSGYLIYGAVIRRRTSYLKFTKRRVERIYPTFLAVFGLYLVLSILFPMKNKIHGDFHQAGIYILENLFLLPGMFHIAPIVTVAWSLSYEFAFYLSLPILVWAIQMRRWEGVFRFVFLLSTWVLLGLATPSINNERIRMISFLAGVVLYELTKLALKQRLLTTWGELGSIIFVLLCFTFFYVSTVYGPTIKFSPALLYFPLTVGLFFLTLYSFEFSGILQKFFSWDPLRFLGSMSYSYYLIHGITLEGVSVGMGILRVPKVSLAGVLAEHIIGFAASWISASALFFLIERKYSLK